MRDEVAPRASLEKLSQWCHTDVMRLLLWAVLGAVFGTSLDAVHVLTGTLVYAHPVLGLQDWWVVPQFALAGILLGETHRRVAVPLSGRTVPPADLREVVRAVLFFVVAYGSSGFLKAFPTVELVAFVVLFGVAVALTPVDARRALLIHAAGAAIAGPIAESLISSTGAFHYLAHDVGGVPRWLPGIYLHAAYATHALDRFLDGRAKRSP